MPKHRSKRKEVPYDVAAFILRAVKEQEGIIERLQQEVADAKHELMQLKATKEYIHSTVR